MSWFQGSKQTRVSQPPLGLASKFAIRQTHDTEMTFFSSITKSRASCCLEDFRLTW